MKRTTAPIVVAFAGAVATVGHAAIISGPILYAVEHGASRWWLWLLASPLITAALSVGASAWLDNRLHRNDSPPPIQYHVIDDEYEHPAADSVDTHFAQVRAALNTLADHTLIPRQRNRDGSS